MGTSPNMVERIAMLKLCAFAGQGRPTIQKLTLMGDVLMRVARKFFTFCLLPLTLSGCGMRWFEYRATDPAIPTTINGRNGPVIRTIATTAERRDIIYNIESQRTCFEPPADVAEAVSASLSSAVRATAQNNATAGAELGANAATAISSLAKRSQGVILFRDASFNLCMQYMNGILDEKSYGTEYSNLIKVVSSLIELEIKETHGHIGPEGSPIITVPTTGEKAIKPAPGDNQNPPVK
jgi:hypothetical protein